MNSTDYRIINRRGKDQKEHRAIIEQQIGRKLRNDEIIHHKDGNKKNNDPANLEILTHEQHASLHMAGRKNPKPEGWKPRNALSRDIIRKIAILNSQGWNYSKIARELGISNMAVRRHVLLILSHSAECERDRG